MNTRRIGTATIVAVGWLLVGLNSLPVGAGGTAKVLTVGSGLKIDAKITDDDKTYIFKLENEGNEIEVKMQAKVYSVKLDGGTKYTITMDTEDAGFDPFIVVHDGTGKTVAFDDDSGGDLNSKLIFSPAKSGTFKIHAASLRGTGAYTLRLAGDKGAKDAGEQPKVLTVGDGLKIDAKITEDDKKYEFKLERNGNVGELTMQAKVYSVKLDAGAKYTITMDTEDAGFDPFLVVQDNNGKAVDFDDDSGGNLNSKLVYSPAKSGTFKIHAAALRGTGSYTLKVIGAKGADPKKALAVGNDGLSINGTLNNDTKNIEYLVKMEKGKTYRIDLKSRDFDAYLFLYGPDGKKLAQDDDGGGGLNSRIEFNCDEDGTYRIRATSLGMRDVGDFVLEVRRKE